jgi:hypothetical protein
MNEGQVMPGKAFLVMVLAALLAACGSGGTGPATPVPAAVASAAPPPDNGNQFVHFEGVWQGTLTSNDPKSSGPAILIVNGWGEFRLFTNDVQYVGFPHRTYSELEGDITGIRSPGSTWNHGTPFAHFQLRGSISEDNFIEATFAGGADSGSMSLAPITASDSGAIGNITGTWILYDELRNAIATFDLDGRGLLEALATGTHSNGCVFSGIIESWTSFNSYNTDGFELSGCPPVNGIEINGLYSGSAVKIDVADDGTDELALVLGLSNDVAQLTFSLYRP